MPARKTYLDANIFIEMVEEVGSSSAPLLIEYLTLNDGSQPPFLVTSELTLADLLTGPYKAKNENLVRTYDNILTAGGNILVWPVDRQILWQAAVMRSNYPGLKLPDAIHLTTAIAHGCSAFMTADKRISGDFKHYDEINQIVSKHTLGVIRRTPDNIRELIADWVNG